MLWHLQEYGGNSNCACHLRKHINDAICVYEKLGDGKTFKGKTYFLTDSHQQMRC